MPRDVDHRPDLMLGVGLAVVLVAAALGPALWALSVRDRLPGEVVRHWGADGLPTATWSLTTQLWVLGAVTVLAAGGCGAAAVLGRMPLTVRRQLAGVAGFVAGLLGTLQAGALVVQLDVEDPLVGASIDRPLLLGVGVGLAVGAALALLTRERDHTLAARMPPPADKPRAAAEAAGEGWTSGPMTSRALLVVAAVPVVLLAATSLVVGPRGPGAGIWALVLLVSLVVLATGRLAVHVSAAGLVVRGAGLTVLRVPLDEVAHAEVVAHLDPLWEFGGWGLRVDVHGRTGVVSRKGPALRVVRADGSEVLVTVDEPENAAGLLNTLADRDRR